MQPFYIRREWNHFLQRFSSAPLERKTLDEPILSLQRNVFFHKRDEGKLRDAKVRWKGVALGMIYRRLVQRLQVI